LRKVVEYIRKNPNEILERNKLSEELKIQPTNISKILSILSDLRYLSYELKGREIQSVAKANEITKFLWEEL
jgi:transcription initiation factor IIE alpha subunit